MAPTAGLRAAARDGEAPLIGEPLQLVRLDVGAGKVEVNEDALGRLEKRMRKMGHKQVAVISVMGAFRTGKSFLLDLFLRFLRYEEKLALGNKEPDPEIAPEHGPEDLPLPTWITEAGDLIEGAEFSDSQGFRFKGGMDVCTEGIWVWSEPFLRHINGKEVAFILMDTQGAWDSNMTKEQSATIFGLTGLLSSKQIYNIQQQIQEDKVEHIAYFARFAQAALRKVLEDLRRAGQATKDQEAEVETPFQSLDFLVRDWRHFGDEMSVEDCRKQMAEHLSRHVDPNRVRENHSAQALRDMFRRISCFCLPHPGRAVEKETWCGAHRDIDRDFLRMVDEYVREVFTVGLNAKRILGSDLSTISFPLVLRDFVTAFRSAAPVAMTFTQAMTNCTVLLAKEQAMKLYASRMGEETSRQQQGYSPDEFQRLAGRIKEEVQDEFRGVTILGTEEMRMEAWSDTEENLGVLYAQYEKANNERLQKALVGFANLALFGAVLFFLDRVSDWVCDWWSDTCNELSKVMLVAYCGIFGYIAYQAYVLFVQRGKVALGLAIVELGKEAAGLVVVYGQVVQTVARSGIPTALRRRLDARQR
mmetsp:Transcript_82494/g.230024  ORF Transcript_82494/g.230024 Transcript_82494/m.230024 type:complete len:587 (-) Transcript_82494:131-1891(-)